MAPFGAMAEAGKEARLAPLLVVSLNDKSIKQLGIGLAFGNLDGVEPIEPGVYLVTDWASGPLYRVDAQGNVVRLLDLHQGTADLSYLPETKTILIPMMLDNALVAYKLERGLKIPLDRSEHRWPSRLAWRGRSALALRLLRSMGGGWRRGFQIPQRGRAS